jgi:hypothetical protein
MAMRDASIAKKLRRQQKDAADARSADRPRRPLALNLT